MYLRRLWIIILLRYSKEKRRADETMDGQNQANRADGQLGERKKDDCGYNYTQFKPHPRRRSVLQSIEMLL